MTVKAARTSEASREMEEILGAALLALVWLVPNHQLPWTAFHHELATAVALATMCFLLCWQAKQGLSFPAFGLVVLTLAFVPWIQWGAGLLPKFGTAFVSSAYLTALALAIAVGFSVRGVAAERLSAVLWLGLTLAALANFPVQTIQWFQWYSTDITSIKSMLVTPIQQGSRPSGSILQPNLLATLLVWGCLGLTWWRVERKIHHSLFWAVFVFIALGLGLTQSRAGLIEFALCTVMLWLFGRHWAGVRVCMAWTMVLIGLVIWSLNFQDVAKALNLLGNAEGRLSAIDGARIDAWRAFGLAVLDNPWWGYGITDVAYPYFLRAETDPQIYIGERFGHAHNILLDLALWVGIPFAVILAWLGASWGWRQLRRAVAQPQLLLPLLLLTSFMVHAMLELPHQYLFMLMPVGLVIGILCRVTEERPLVRMGRAGAALAAFLIGGSSAALSWDYFPYQERYTEWRFDSLGVGYRLDREIKRPLILDQLHDELTLYRMDLSSPLPPETLVWIEETAAETTTGPAMYAAAKAFAISGQYTDAVRWMLRYNATHPPSLVEQARRIWGRDQLKYPALEAIDWPLYSGKTSTFRLEPKPVPNP